MPPSAEDPAGTGATPAGLPAGPLLPIDERGRMLAQRLVRSSEVASLATLDPVSGHPFVTLVTPASDYDGSPILLLSELSAHTRALRADPRCSLLMAQPGGGDPLAHPRITVVATATRISRGQRARDRLRDRFLSRHPAAALYLDFPDFDLFRLQVERALLNAGFGRAYALSATDLVRPLGDELEAFWQTVPPLIDRLNGSRLEDVRLIARQLCGEPEGAWRVAGIDPEGIDLRTEDRSVRHPFEQRVGHAAELAGRLDLLVAAASERGD